MIVANPGVVRWVEHKLGEKFASDYGIGIMRDGKIVGGVAYDVFSKDSCNMHVFADCKHWFTREFAAVAFGIPFTQWGMERVTAPIYADNLRAVNFVKRIGFTLEGTLRGKRPVELYGMLKDECRWIGEIHG